MTCARPECMRVTEIAPAEQKADAHTHREVCMACGARAYVTYRGEDEIERLPVPTAPQTEH